MGTRKDARKRARRTRGWIGVCVALCLLAGLVVFVAGQAGRDPVSPTAPSAAVPSATPDEAPPPEATDGSPVVEQAATPDEAPTPEATDERPMIEQAATPAPTPRATHPPVPTQAPTPEPKRVKTKLPYLLVVNKKAQLVLVYTTDQHGEYTVPVKTMRCSTGKVDKLPAGNYKLQGKGARWRWRKMFSGVYVQYATRISGNILFHSISYKKSDPSTLIASTYKQLGKPVSGGCVRLLTKDAKWIYENCPGGTRVQVAKGKAMPEAEWSKPDLISGKWDPTDSDPDNPDYLDESDATPAPTAYPYATPKPTPGIKWGKLRSGRQG